MNRRETLFGIPAALWAGTLNAQVSNIVQLYLLRESAEPNVCSPTVKFIRGNLYGVPSAMKLTDVSSTLGLTHISKTEELPYEANAQNVSSVPAAIYRAKIREEATKPWMTNVNRKWRLE